MKKLLLLTALSTIATASFSQISKGQWLVGGSAGFNSNKSESLYSELTENTIQLAPNIGYFISDKLAAGARINLTRDKIKSGSNPDYSSTTKGISLSPFVRYYFFPKTEKLNLFADAGYSYGRVKYTSKSGIPTDSSYASKGTSHGYYISAGPVIFLNAHTALELKVSYDHSKVKKFDNTNNNLMVGVGFQIHLGK